MASDNKASRRIAEQVISTTPEALTEGNFGLPAFKSGRKIALFKPTQQHRPEDFLLALTREVIWLEGVEKAPFLVREYG